MGIRSRFWLHLGLGLSLGMAAVSLWVVGLPRRWRRMGLGSRQLCWPVVCEQLPSYSGCSETACGMAARDSSVVACQQLAQADDPCWQGGWIASVYSGRTHPSEL